MHRKIVWHEKPFLWLIWLAIMLHGYFYPNTEQENINILMEKLGE